MTMPFYSVRLWLKVRLSLTKVALLAGALAGIVGAAGDLAAGRNLAPAALLVGDYERALELADDILATWPDDAATRLIRGLALMARGEFEAAERDLRAAREAYPDDIAVLYNLAVIAERRGDYRNGLHYLDEAFARGLDRDNAHLLKAKLLDHLGRGGEARDTLEYYLTRRPGTREMYLARAEGSRAAGDADKASAYDEEAWKYGRDGPTLAELAATYEAAGDRRSAVDHYSEAVVEGAASADVLAEYAADYAAAAEFEQALEIYQRLVDRFPKNAHYLFGLSFVKQQVGRVEEARAGYMEVVRLKPDFAEPYYNLAALADVDEDADAAASYYRGFLSYSAGRDDLAESRAKASQRLELLEGL